MKNVLVTGASSGIGFDYVKKNLNKNFEFFLIGRNFNNLKNYIKKKNINQKSISLTSILKIK